MLGVVDVDWERPLVHGPLGCDIRGSVSALLPKPHSWGVKPHFGDWEILCVRCNFNVFSHLKEEPPIVLFLQLLASLCSFPTNSSGRLPLALYTFHTNFHLREHILRIFIPLLDKFHSVNTSRDLKKLLILRLLLNSNASYLINFS